MAYNEKLANRVRELLLTKKSVKEKNMMGGLTFMVNNKMCVGILNDDLMARIDPEISMAVLDKRGCREMDFTGRPMKGFVFVEPTGSDIENDLEYWIKLALEFNPKAKSSKNKNK